MSTSYSIRICQECAEKLSNGDSVDTPACMGIPGHIVITGDEYEFMRADCNLCGTHMTGNFIDAEELEVN